MIEINKFIPAIDKIFSDFAKNSSPGCSLAIVQQGKVLYKNGYGLANLEHIVPITPATIFHVASVSKQFTCFAILLLEQQNKLSLDDDIHEYLSEIPDFGKKITIRHLCYHTSGLRDQWELLVLGGWRMDDVITKDHIFKMVKRQNVLNFEPGAEHLYCNTGYTLMAEIVARVSGRNFPEFTKENIFEPLGMNSTHFHDDHELIVPNRADCYDKREDGTFKKSILSYANVGATSLFTSAEDMTKWLTNLDDAKVGGIELRDKMHEQGRLNDCKTITYALGQEVTTYKGLKIVQHSGGDAGFRSHVVRFPEQGLGIVIFSNYAQSDPQKLTLNIGEILLNKKIDEKVISFIDVDPKILNKYTGKYLTSMGVAEVILKDKRLRVEVRGMKINLSATSETEFILEGLGGEGVFEDILGDKAQKFSVHVMNQEIVGKRVQKFTLEPQLMRQYVGSYFSEEVDTSYYINQVEDKLVMKHRRHEDKILLPIKQDKFATEGERSITIIFTRNPDTNIKGYLVQTGRVRNLRFKKQC